MNIIVNKTEYGSIEFLNEGMILYYIEQDMVRHGFHHWFRILSENQWFTPEVYAQFKLEWERK